MPLPSHDAVTACRTAPTGELEHPFRSAMCQHLVLADMGHNHPPDMLVYYPELLCLDPIHVPFQSQYSCCILLLLVWGGLLKSLQQSHFTLLDRYLEDGRRQGCQSEPCRRRSCPWTKSLDYSLRQGILFKACRTRPTWVS